VFDGGPDAEEHRSHADGQLGRTFGDQALLLGVAQGAGVGPHLEGAHQVRGGPAVGPSHEAVAFEPAEVAADGHLRNLEVAREGADLDRLILGHALQHLQASLHR